MTVPVVLTVKRYRCPYCIRWSRSSKAKTVEHMGRCWYNPAAHGCKTCANFEPEADACGCESGCNWGNSGQSVPEHCSAGVDLSGRPPCPGCGGYGWADMNNDAQRPCTPETTTCHIGDGREVKPGPITGCPKWAPTQSSPTERS